MYDALLDEELVEASGVATKLTDDETTKALEDVDDEPIDADPDVDVEANLEPEEGADETAGSEGARHVLEGHGCG